MGETSTALTVSVPVSGVSVAGMSVKSPESTSPSPPECRGVPLALSSFVDSFVDFSVSGLFFPSQRALPPPPPPSAPIARVVAIGDLHGDLNKSLEAFSICGLVDPFTSRWTGGTTVAVQIGDILDRGDEELRLLYLIHRLRFDAAASGGALVTLNGNHEIMNADSDFRYSTPAGLDEFNQWALFYRSGVAMKRLVPALPPPPDPFKGIPTSFPGIKPEYWQAFRSRIAALRPGGPISRRFLSDNETVLVLGNSVFVHGGILDYHVDYGINRINSEVRNWLLGSSGERSPSYMRSESSVVWLRKFSEGECSDCNDLTEVLAMIPGARRMIMGHTIQEEGINSVCGDRAIRIDVGLSKGCADGLPQVLEIYNGEDLRVVTSNRVTLHKDNNNRPMLLRRDDPREEGLAMLLKERKVHEMEVTS